MMPLSQVPEVGGGDGWDSELHILFVNDLLIIILGA